MSKPSFRYLTRDGKLHRKRPREKPYYIVIHNKAAYERACNTGRIYGDLKGQDGPTVDWRKP